MNIFYLHSTAAICARMHCDKHVVKMATEYAQLMSTCHRVLDGQEYYEKTANNRRIKRWALDPWRESVMYKASHVNHPCNIWLRGSSQHYRWLWTMWTYLCQEYTLRYGKTHKTSLMRGHLFEKPFNLQDNGWTDPPQCMPDHCKDPDVIQAYRNFYLTEKSSFATWKTKVPEWYTLEAA